MKKDIHPAYYPQAIVTCSCGVTHVVGSTMKEIHVEICSACHPFYTGEGKILDTAGRVEKFKARMAAATGHIRKPVKKQEKRALAQVQKEKKPARKKTVKEKK